jgi:N utilization substance protein B
MLSRHYLRAKALQNIYGCHIAQDTDPHEAAIQFDHRINRLNILGIYQLSLLTELVKTAERVDEEVKHKFAPTEEELKPSTRLVANQLITHLRDNYDFRKWCDKLVLNWDIHSADFHAFYNTVKSSEVYRECLAEPENFQQDKKVALMLFCDIINNTAIRQLILDRDITWEDDYDQIAQYNYLMLKELNETFDASAHLPLMNDPDNEKDKDAFEFAKLLVRQTLTDITANEEIIRSHLSSGWEFDRVATMDVMIINMAITEFTCCPSIPISVTIDEYVELTKEYSTDKSKIFINGILDKICTDLKMSGRVNKVGRGIDFADDKKGV